MTHSVRWVSGTLSASSAWSRTPTVSRSLTIDDLSPWRVYWYWVVGNRKGAFGKLSMQATSTGASVGLDTANWNSPPGIDERRSSAPRTG